MRSRDPYDAFDTACGVIIAILMLLAIWRGHDGRAGDGQVIEDQRAGAIAFRTREPDIPTEAGDGMPERRR